ncbi:MAG TPA: TetR family transcriptional regulator [Candidatus Dormibacteraeota bacterium]|nr:TetR family transcriptional regulator [Candidatus Dormibacteraeota bacterium]
MLSQDERSTPGLRERKKARTRAAIQRHALRLFREQGYDTTSVSQIAEAAEVSESTFFRYFPTKEDVVLWDEYDPRIVEVFRAQPAELSPIAALRAAFREVLAQISEAEQADQRERMALMLSVPPLRAMLVDQIGGPMRLLAELVGERVGRRPDDPGVRVVAGAVLGVGLAVMFAWAEDPNADMVALVDDAMARLEAGLRLQ